MISIDQIRQNPEKIRQAAKNKGIADIDLDGIIHLDDKRKDLLSQIQQLNEKRNKLSREEGIREGKQIKEQLAVLKTQLNQVQDDLDSNLSRIPNPPVEEVKAGKDESENDVVESWGEKPNFDFEPKDHLDLAETLDIIDVKRAAKVSGSRFAYLKNQAVRLEFALVNFVFDMLEQENFSLMVPPVLIKAEITKKLGYWEAGGNQDYYIVEEPDEKEGSMYLVGTAEHSVVPYHSNEILNSKDLPVRYQAFSTCFRREAGSYGKDVRGIMRVHQFDKVEMVSFTTEQKAEEEFEFLLSLQKKLLKSMQIPFRVVKMCSGDLGFPAACKYDLEAWIPSQQKYREVTSVSTTTDFQSRRFNIKYREGENKEYVHILNGTACAIGRTIVAIMENFQQKDGTIIIPEVLRKYVGRDKISV